MDTETRSYEIGYLLNSGLKDEEITAFSERIRNFVTDKGGLILSEGGAKKILLAYPIKKESWAIFNWIKFVLKPESLKELQNSVESDSAVLRYLMIKPRKEPVAKPFSKIKPKAKKVVIEPKPESSPDATDKKEPVAETETGVKEEEIDKKIEELLGE